MRCRACDTVWLVSGPSSASAVADALGDETAPRAAVTRRGAERERRDLFASRPVEDGGVKETMRPPPSFASTVGGGGVAARNENSVLFKVTDVLGPSGTARVKTPEPSLAPPSSASGSLAPQSRDGKEDSGIIDLKALSSAPPRANRAPAPMLFGASEAPPAFSRDVSASSSSYPQAGPAAARSKVRTFGMIAAGFAVVALCGVGVALAFGGENPAPKAAAAPAPPPPPTAPPVVTPPPAPEPASTATASNEETSSSSKKTTGKKRKGAGKSGGSSTSSGLTSKSPPPPPPPKVKAADPCGCHGDFNCILACTAGKR